MAERLRDVLADQDLLDQAIDAAYTRLTQRRPGRDTERQVTLDKLRETRTALERYFRAFETATMPEDACAPRINELTAQARQLEQRAAQLADENHEETEERIGPDDLDALRHQFHQALDHGPIQRRKAILQALTDTITVDGRDNIQPVFRVLAVRRGCPTFRVGGSVG